MSACLRVCVCVCVCVCACCVCACVYSTYSGYILLNWCPCLRSGARCVTSHHVLSDAVMTSAKPDRSLAISTVSVFVCVCMCVCVRVHVCSSRKHTSKRLRQGSAA